MIGRPSPPSKLSSADIADNAIGTAHIQANVITHADLAPNSVTSSEMADDAVGIAELSASGTPNATSFLRGDNSWQVVDTEGTGIKSTGESGGNKFLREDGDGTSSWQVAGSPSITDNGNATALTIDSDEALTVNGSFKQLTNRNLSGTYSSHELFIADGYTLTGNITVNEDIALTKLSDDGTTITLTTDGTSRTITGTGSIEASTIAQTPVTSVTGMTGELGSAVTGSPNLNLTSGTIGSTVTFPTGHILGVQNVVMQGTQSIGTSLIDVTDGTTQLLVTSTNTTATKFYIVAMVYCGTDQDVGTHFELWTEIDGGGFSKLDAAHGNYGGGGSSHKDFMFAAAGDNDTWNRYTGTHCTSSYLWTPGSFSTSVSVKIRADGYSGTTYIGRNYNHNNSSDWAHSVPSTLTIWEIK